MKRSPKRSRPAPRRRSCSTAMRIVDHAPSGERSASSASTGPSTSDSMKSPRVERAPQRFGSRFRPVLAPPWNRVGDDVVEHCLPREFTRCRASVTRRRAPATESRQARRISIPSHGGTWTRIHRRAGSGGTHHCAPQGGARNEEVDPSEPTGLLTHHLAFPDDAFISSGELIAPHRGIRSSLARSWMRRSSREMRRYFRPISMDLM